MGVKVAPIDALSVIFLAVIFSSIFPLTGSLTRSDSFLESISLKEASMGILRDRMIEEMKLRNFHRRRRSLISMP